MKLFIFICFLPSIISSFEHDGYVNINSDDDCWSMEKNKTIDGTFATLVKFQPKINFEKTNCSVRINNPWVTNPKNGFGVFIQRALDCSTILIIDCLSDVIYSNQLTCHTSDSKFEVPCNSINLMFKTNGRNQEMKKPTRVQVVALAKGPCVERDLLFKCPNDYPDSCIDKGLRCNGRSECPDGGDERDCHPSTSPGMPIIVIVLIVLAVLVVLCGLSAVLICYCCRMVCKKCIQGIRIKKPKDDVKVTGEDAELMKQLPGSANFADTASQQPTDTLTINSTQPIYPSLKLT